MAGNLPDFGVNAVVQNFTTYVNQINQMVNVTNQAGNAITNAAKATENHDKSTNKLVSTLSKFNPQIGQMTEKFSSMAEEAGVAGESIAALAVPVAVAAAALVGFFALAQRGAGFSDIEHGFDVLTASAGQSADVLLGRMKQATDGTVDDMKLMGEVNNALIGINSNLAKSFGEDLPGMMTIARNIALATGQDMESVFNRITEAVRRGNTRQLQSIGIVIDQKKAFEEYAKSIGETSKQLDKNQQEQAVLNAVMEQGKQVSDALGNSTESNATKMQQAGTSITNIFDDLSKTLQPILSVIMDVINMVLGAVGDLVHEITPYITAFVELITGGLDTLTGGAQKTVSVLDGVKAFLHNVVSFIGTLVKSFFEGGAAIIGALAGGITWAKNNIIYPAIIGIVNLIANFLMGNSPPPMGRLSTIDEGGAHLMESWMEGMTGVSLEPVATVAARVAGIMGSTANMAMAQVKQRLEELDKAILPFQEQLDLVKNRFDQIKGVTTPAIDAIDRQISMLQQALANGDKGAEQQIKRLDAQKQKLQDYVDIQQQSVDQAEIQLALAKLQQGDERARLQTREAILKQEQALSTSGKTGAAKQQKQKGGKGGGAGLGEDTGTPNLGGDQQTTDAQQAGIDVAQAYQEGYTSTAGNMGDAISAANDTQLKAATNRLSTGFNDMVNKFKKPFDDIVTNVSNALGDNPNGLVGKIKDFVETQIPNALSSLGNGLYVNLVLPIKNHAAQVIAFFSDGSDPNSIPGQVKTFISATIPNAFTQLGNTIETNLAQPFANKVDEIKTNITHFFNESGDGTLTDIFDKMIAFLTGLPAKAASAFSDLAKSIFKTFSHPIVDALNGLIGAFQDFINNVVLQGIRNLLNAFTNLPLGLGDKFKNAVAGITNVTFDRLSYPDIGGAAEGGMFGGGLLKVGERGQELVSSASPMAVFPNNFVTALDRLTEVISRPATAQSMYNTTNYSTQNNTFNGIQGAEDAIREFARLQAVTAH